MRIPGFLQVPKSAAARQAHTKPRAGFGGYLVPPCAARERGALQVCGRSVKIRAKYQPLYPKKERKKTWRGRRNLW